MGTDIHVARKRTPLFQAVSITVTLSRIAPTIGFADRKPLEVIRMGTGEAARFGKQDERHVLAVAELVVKLIPGPLVYRGVIRAGNGIIVEEMRMIRPAPIILRIGAGFVNRHNAEPVDVIDVLLCLSKPTSTSS